MTSEVIPSSFLVDFMKRRDIVNLVRKAESNQALRSRIDILVSVWQLTWAAERSSTPRGSSQLRKGVDSTYNLIRSSVNPNNARVKWSEWLNKRDLILAEAEEERRSAKKGNKKGFRVQEKSRIEDVARFEAAFGIEDAVLLANLTDVPTWYAWPRPRKELILYYLDPENGRSNRDTTSLGTKRSANDSANGSEGHTERNIAKQVCQGRQSTVITGVGSILDMNELTDGTGLDHPVIRPAWTGIGKPFLPIYDGQSSIMGSTDRWIQYRWSAISAMEIMLEREALPKSSDVLWLYYSVDRSKVQKLPFAALSRRIQRSEHWRQEGEQGLTDTACLRLAFPRDQLECYGPYCNFACIVSAADAPKLG